MKRPVPVPVRNVRLVLALSVLLAAPVASRGQFIQIRVSIKVITHPTTGARPGGVTDALLLMAETNANQWMGSYGRGYRFDLREIVDIGGPNNGGASGPSKWFGDDPRGATEWPVFQNDINTDARYARRTDMVNFYITTGVSSNPGGACPIPPGDAHLIACHGFVNGGPWWLNHELGHFFGLSHTFGGCTCSGGCDYPESGDDGIADTLPESSCDTQDQIAQRSFGQNYASLSAAQQLQADNTFFNVMSYHNAATKDLVETVMTELQLDHHANTANGLRRAFVTGDTIFASPSGLDFLSGLSSGAPKRTLTAALTVASANGSDIVLLKAGSYPENLTISKAVTLRATRVGPATIGN